MELVRTLGGIHRRLRYLTKWNGQCSLEHTLIDRTLHSEWIPIKAGRIYTRLGGVHSDHRPIVLMHGFVLASDYMMPVAHVLASLYHVYALDLPGYGRSDKPQHGMGLPDLADSVAEWMGALKLRTAHFIGNSFGCQVITEFAARHAHLVGRLVLQGPTVGPNARTLGKQILRLLKNSRIESPGLGRVMLRDYWRAGLRRIIDTARMALHDVVETKLPDITAPALVVRGSRDVLVSQEWAERVTQLLPRGQVLVPNRVQRGPDHNEWRINREVIMPERKTIRRAQQKQRKGDRPTTQAGEFVREEIDHIREGKHGARSTKQAIAIGLSKARRAGVKLPPPKKGTVPESTRRKAKQDYKKGMRESSRSPSRHRSQARLRV